MLKLTLPNGTIKEYPEGITLLEVGRELNGFYSQPVVEGIFNGVGTDLQKPLHSDGIVDFITWDTEEGRRVYVRSLLFLFLYAIKTLRPEVQLEVCNSIGSALYCDITNGIVLSKYDLRDIDLFMRKLIAAQEPIVYSTISRAEAEKFWWNAVRTTVCSFWATRPARRRLRCISCAIIWSIFWRHDAGLQLFKAV